VIETSRTPCGELADIHFKAEGISEKATEAVYDDDG
jgi:hypothetical protein